MSYRKLTRVAQNGPFFPLWQAISEVALDNGLAYRHAYKVPYSVGQCAKATLALGTLSASDFETLCIGEFSEASKIEATNPGLEIASNILNNYFNNPRNL